MKKLSIMVLTATAVSASMFSAQAASIFDGQNGNGGNNHPGFELNLNSYVHNNYLAKTNVPGPGHSAVGQDNYVYSTQGSSSAYGNQNDVDGKGANAFGNNNTANGDLAQAFGHTNRVFGNQSVGYGVNNTIGTYVKVTTKRTVTPDYITEEISWQDMKGNSLGEPTVRTVPRDPDCDERFQPTILSAADIIDECPPEGERTVERRIMDKPANNASAFGSGNNVFAHQGTAIGHNNKVTGENGVALGTGNQASGLNSVAIGNGATATAENSMAFGANAKATHQGSVALGANSQTSEVVQTQSHTHMGIYYGRFAGNNPTSTVSVGAPNQERTITNVAAGRISETSTDAVNGSQLFTVTDAMGRMANSTAQVLGGNARVHPDGSLSMSNIGDTGENTVHDAIKSVHNQLQKGLTFAGDQGTSSETKLGSTFNIKGDGQNITTEANGNQLTVRMSSTPTFNSVTSQQYNVGDKTYINSQGLNANNQKIRNVAPGEISQNSTDAINGSQLYDTNQHIQNLSNTTNQSISKLRNDVKKVGAGAAALAALHPLDFNPDDKWNFAVGYGNYQSANAVALGAFYRPNEDTLINVAGSLGNGKNMINTGISFKFGQTNNVSASKIALAKEVEALKELVLAQQQDLATLRGTIHNGTNIDMNLNVNFPDVPENHWAYEYVKSLADRGLLEGYPDGEFKGDRPMTRYEFATIIYRALQNGAPMDADLNKAVIEFNPELARVEVLDRIRIDRISGNDKDRYKVDRIRINNEDTATRDIYGEQLI